MSHCIEIRFTLLVNKAWVTAVMMTLSAWLCATPQSPVLSSHDASWEPQTGLLVALMLPHIIQLWSHLAVYCVSINANQTEMTSSIMRLVAVSLRSSLRSSFRRRQNAWWEGHSQSHTLHVAQLIKGTLPQQPKKWYKQAWIAWLYYSAEVCSPGVRAMKPSCRRTCGREFQNSHG